MMKALNIWKKIRFTAMILEALMAKMQTIVYLVWEQTRWKRNHLKVKARYIYDHRVYSRR